MTEIRIVRAADLVKISVVDRQSTTSILDLAPFFGLPAEHEVVQYGIRLAECAFDAEQRRLLAALSPGSRILLDITDGRLATIPWETLRIGGRLLAAHCAFTRWASAEGQRTNGTRAFAGALNLVAIPVAPIDGYQPVIATEREYHGLESVIAASSASLRLVRVRPATLGATADAIRKESPNGVFFMGHSDSLDGHSVLAFEDETGRTRLVEARELAAILGDDVVFVILNSCWSARAGSATEFGDIARGLVKQGIPHALGMQSALLDEAAILLSRQLLSALLIGTDFEEAVRRVREFFDLNGCEWIATIPVCYTCMRDEPATLQVAPGRPQIEPSPAAIAARTDLGALPMPEELIGRGSEISAILDALSEPFVALHGLGGIGKSTLARAAAERIAWRYDDRVLAVTFDVVDERFAENLLARLARFYGIEPGASDNSDDLAARVLEARGQLASLLVLDNVETLFEAMEREVPHALVLGGLIRRLHDGPGNVLFTSRILPPESWSYRVVEVGGLRAEDGSALFESIAAGRGMGGLNPALTGALSELVGGHPLSIRLLASRFAASEEELQTFIKNVDDALTAHIDGSADDDRQATLKACLRYSLERLDASARTTLEKLTLFSAPFVDSFAAALLDSDSEAIRAVLGSLVRIGLLTQRRETWSDATVSLYSMHPTLRWYLRRTSAPPTADELQRFGDVFLGFATLAEGQSAVDQDTWLRHVLYSSLPDFELALRVLDPMQRARLSVLLIRLFEYLGQIQRARQLGEAALPVAEEHGDEVLIVACLLRLGDLMLKMGEPSETIVALYERAIGIGKNLDPDSGVTSAIHVQLGEIQVKIGRPQEALASYSLARQALAHEHSGNPATRRRLEATCDYMTARVLGILGRDDEAMDLLPPAIHTLQRDGDLRAASIALDILADLHERQKRHHESLRARERSLELMHRVGDARATAVIEGKLAKTLTMLGRADEALVLLENAEAVLLRAGDILEAASVQVLLSLHYQAGNQLGKAIQRLWDAHQAYASVGKNDSAKNTETFLCEMKASSGARVFRNWWRSTIGEPEPPWLQDVETAAEAPRGQAGLAERALTDALNNTLLALQPGNQVGAASGREKLFGIGEEFRHDGEMMLAAFNDALVAVLDALPAQLACDHPYYIPFQEFLAAAEKITGRNMGADPKLPLYRAAIRDLLNATTPEQLARCVREHASVLAGGPEIVTYLRALSSQAYSKGDRDLSDGLATIAQLLESSPKKEDQPIDVFTDAARAELSSPSTRARQSALAALGESRDREAMLEDLDAIMHNSSSDAERMFLAGLRMGMIEGRADNVSLSFEDRSLTRAWEEFQRILTSGGVHPSAFEKLRDAALAALAPDADPASASTCRHLLAAMRNDAITAGRRSFVDLVDVLTQLVDIHESGSSLLDPELNDLGNRVRGTHYRIWREILAQVRIRYRPPMDPALRNAISALLDYESQAGTIKVLRAHARELVSDEAIDHLRELSVKQRGLEDFDKLLDTLIRLLEDAQRRGLAVAITRDVARTFAEVNDPAAMLPVFDACAELLVPASADEVFAQLGRHQRGIPRARAVLLRIHQQFRRILRHGTTVAAQDLRLGRYEAAQELVRGFIEYSLGPDSQETHLLRHEASLQDPELNPFIDDVAEAMKKSVEEQPFGEDLAHALDVQMELLDRCRTNGIVSTLEHRRQLIALILEILSAPLSSQLAVVLRIDAAHPGVLTGDEVRATLFELEENNRSANNWTAVALIRRFRMIHGLLNKHGLEVAFEIGHRAFTRQSELLTVLTEMQEADSFTALHDVVVRHFDLLSDPSTDDLVDDVLTEVRRTAPSEILGYIEQQYELIRSCRVIGIEETFRRLQS